MTDHEQGGVGDVPKITLYNNRMSPCAQKVRIVLAEKVIPYETRDVDLPGKENLQPWYLKLNPAGVVPTLVDGDHVLRESSLICEYLDEAYSGDVSLRPDAPHLRAEIRLWMKHVDNSLHPSCGALQWPLAMRPRLLEMDRDEALALIAQVVEAPRRERQKRLFDKGLDAPDVRNAVGVYCQTIDRMERDLQDRDWLIGDHLSLADIVVAPYFQTLLQYGWTDLYAATHPRVTGWIERLQGRDSWKAAIKADFDAETRAYLRGIGTKAWPKIQTHMAYTGAS
ncbi:glutathione S-transferase family protein [Octadecabacter sp. SW4]|uniref:glutathione S-transferase family protein n=1 Tax=Octadecabacter sp. SW4 TaxID=2602067 RepID=UPI0011C20188|nr:glutathione S-transferase family protein [Octadecabacter sp. SW4]QEE36115.1 glutathione S-transferase family protein [Octadecabacter sp. SW4]